MTKKQEQAKLKEFIQNSEIQESMRQLKKLLDQYQKRKHIRGIAYSVQLKFIETYKKIDNLEHELKDLIQLSKSWEEK